MTRLRLRFVLVSIVLVLAVGCTSFSDGAFQQVEGRFFDARRVEEIIEGKTSEKEILEWFGLPVSTSFGQDGIKVLEYYSVRTRTSTERRLFKKNRHRQSVTERLTIEVAGGKVVSQNYDNQITEN